MELTDLVKRDFVKVAPETKISEIVGYMMKGEEAVGIFDESEFVGIISINDLIDRDYPTETKAKNLVRKNIPKVKVEELDFIKVAKMFLENNVKAIPIFENGELIGFICERDFVINSGSYVSKYPKTVKEISSIPEVIEDNESIGKARTVIKEKNVSRLPVVDKEGKLVGIIDVTDFLKTINPKEGIGKKDSAGESLPEYKLTVTTVMNPNPLFVEENISCKEVVKLFEKYNTSYVLITKDKKPLGIVTSKDILELIASLEEEKGIYVQITGLKEVEDTFDRDKIDDVVSECAKKIGKIEDVEYLFVHIKSSQKEGKQKLYLVRTRVSTPNGLFVGKSSNWNPITAVEEALEHLERQITEKHEKLQDLKRPRGA